MAPRNSSLSISVLRIFPVLNVFRVSMLRIHSCVRIKVGALLYPLVGLFAYRAGTRWDLRLRGFLKYRSRSTAVFPPCRARDCEQGSCLAGEPLFFHQRDASKIIQKIIQQHLNLGNDGPFGLIRSRTMAPVHSDEL